MKNTFLALGATALLLSACAGDQPVASFTNINKLYNPDSLPKQTFSINAGKDTILKGAQGTMLRIDKNSFVDAAGNAITGTVQVELKEALTPLDMVLGNLTTTSNGQALQTGGMVYVNAGANGSPVFLGADKSIGVAVPTDSVKQGMSIYEGVPVANNKGDNEMHGPAGDTLATLNWQNPVPIVQQQPAAPAGEAVAVADTFKVPLNPTGKACNFSYYVDGRDVPPQKVITYFENLCSSGKGLKIKNDSLIRVEGFNVLLVSSIRWDEKKWDNGRGQDWVIEIPDINGPGTNTFNEDENARYIFEMKKLGWANIDRLYHNPTTQPVALTVNIDGSSKFGIVYTTMLIDGMYLPGYQKKDKTYSFTHGDFEETQLPVGMPATIIATAYKDDKAYIAIQKITISKSQTVNLKMDETTVEGLKKTLKEKI